MATEISRFITPYNAGGEPLYVEIPPDNPLGNVASYQITDDHAAVCFMAAFRSGWRLDDETGRYVRNRIEAFAIRTYYRDTNPPRSTLEDCPRTPKLDATRRKLAAGDKPVYTTI